ARDEQVITSWNAMMLQGLVDAYIGCGEVQYLTLALRNARFIEKHLKQGTELYHSYSQGQLGMPGYLEDYAWVAQAFISLYQVTFEAHWLSTAEALVQYALAHFYDEKIGLFHFVATNEPQLIAQPKGLFDEVMPSPNSVMGHNLLALGVLLDNPAYTNTAVQMLRKISPRLPDHAAYLANWATLFMRQLHPPVVVAIIGPACRTWALTLQQRLLGKAWLVGTEAASDYLPWLAHKQAMDGKTTIYVCRQGVCLPPTHSIAEALAQVAGID
ncbi:MAG: thioredoxin domain-containing protein, partial [Bacteroidota bacterium]